MSLSPVSLMVSKNPRLNAALGEVVDPTKLPEMIEMGLEKDSLFTVVK